ncbi:MAG: glycosyltransferase family 39 protein [Lachnospiraceae bacterium]|nr:glycosyltransferase family 39 protein [Lachnospiraceae bacterium]
MIYLIGIILYLGIMHLFTIPVHLNVDEELYISMARSFHYEGVFEKNGNILDYSCVLYSMILSIAYYFYSPENIMYILRAINVIIMLSSVFPIFFLGERIFKNEKNALFACAFSLFLPTMMNTAYCMQEVLAYPLFLWAIYFIYSEIEKDKILSVSKESIVITVLSIVCYFTKTYMIFIPLVYFGLILLEATRKKRISVWKKLILLGGIAVFLYILGKYGIIYINNGATGTNHYAAQFSWLFPITWETIIAAIGCITVYVASLLFYWGVLPVILPLCNLKRYSEKDKKFFCFLFLSICVLIVEIVISIVLTEEGNVLVPKKLLYRYFQIFEVPLLMIFVKEIESLEIPKKILAVYRGVFGILVFYFVYIGDGQRTSIIDAPVFLLMENITRYMIPYFNIFVCGIAAVFVGLGAFLYIKKKWNGQALLKVFEKVCLFCIILFFVINLVQLPYYNNVIADGKQIEADAVKIAHYLEEDEKYTDIYYVKAKTDRYEQSVYAYLKEKVYYVTVDTLKEINDKEAIIIASSQCDVGENFKKIELNTEVLNVIKLK